MAFDGLVKKLRNTTAVAGLGLAALLPMSNKAEAQAVPSLDLSGELKRADGTETISSGQNIVPNTQYVWDVTIAYHGEGIVNLSLDALFNASASNSNIRMDSVGPNGTTCNLGTGPVTLNNGSVIDFYNPSFSLAPGNTSIIAQFYFTPTSEGGTFHISPNTTPGSIQVYQGETPWTGNASWANFDDSHPIGGAPAPEPAETGAIVVGGTLGTLMFMRGRKKVKNAFDFIREKARDATGHYDRLPNEAFYQPSRYGSYSLPDASKSGTSTSSATAHDYKPYRYCDASSIPVVAAKTLPLTV
jgi:hypothetical protein